MAEWCCQAGDDGNMVRDERTQAHIYCCLGGTGMDIEIQIYMPESTYNRLELLIVYQSPMARPCAMMLLCACAHDLIKWRPIVMLVTEQA